GQLPHLLCVGPRPEGRRTRRARGRGRCDAHRPARSRSGLDRCRALAALGRPGRALGGDRHRRGRALPAPPVGRARRPVARPRTHRPRAGRPAMRRCFLRLGEPADAQPRRALAARRRLNPCPLAPAPPRQPPQPAAARTRAPPPRPTPEDPMTPPPRRRTVLGAALATLPALGLAACGEVTVEGRTEEAEQLRIIDDQDREVLLPGPART